MDRSSPEYDGDMALQLHLEEVQEELNDEHFSFQSWGPSCEPRGGNH